MNKNKGKAVPCSSTSEGGTFFSILVGLVNPQIVFNVKRAAVPSTLETTTAFKEVTIRRHSLNVIIGIQAGAKSDNVQSVQSDSGR